MRLRSFGRATMGVSLVAPAYLADLACEKARLLIATEFDDASTTTSNSNEQPALYLDPLKIHNAVRTDPLRRLDSALWGADHLLLPRSSTATKACPTAGSFEPPAFLPTRSARSASCSRRDTARSLLYSTA